MPDDDGSNVVTLHPAAGKSKRGTKQGRKANSPQGATSGAKAITAKTLEGRAIELRLRGYSLEAIADELGWETPSAAYKAIMRGLAVEYPEAQRDQLRRLELAKLDRLEAAHTPAATNGVPVMIEDEPLLDREGYAVMTPPSEKSAGVVIRCIQMRSKLQGLEAPVQVALSTREGEAVEINVTHSLDPAFVAAAELVRDRIVRQSIERAGDVIDVTPPDLV